MTAYTPQLEPRFIQVEGADLFTLTLHPPEKPLGTVLYLPPFAEEANRSRRIVATQARALASSGYKVVCLDLEGCGDSAGEFRDANWQRWQDQSLVVAQRLSQELDGPLCLWGLRLGALLGAAIASQLSTLSRLVMWQPVINGEIHLDQFLRIELASQMMDDKRTFDRASLWDKIRAGDSLEVAGYQLNPDLCQQIAQLRMVDQNPNCPTVWLDVGSRERSEPLPGNEAVLDAWSAKRDDVRWDAVLGSAFWRNIESPTPPELIERTTSELVVIDA